jgi:hypothetical protein
VRKQHQQDRTHRGYIEKALCGIEMPRENSWGLESCGGCSRVAAARKAREHTPTKTAAQLEREIAESLKQKSVTP